MLRKQIELTIKTTNNDDVRSALKRILKNVDNRLDGSITYEWYRTKITLYDATSDQTIRLSRKAIEQLGEIINRKPTQAEIAEITDELQHVMEGKVPHE